MIDKSKTYKTRSGLDVRIYATGGGDAYPVHGAILHGGIWQPRSWRSDGQYSEPYGVLDLLESRPLVHVKGWVNVYEGTHPDRPIVSGLYQSPGAAADAATGTRIACIHVDVTGERL